MRSSPLQLKELFFPLVSVRALVPKEKTNARQHFTSDDLKIAFDFEIDNEKNTACAALHIETIDINRADPQVFYELDIEVFAVFDIISPEFSDEKALYLRKFAAASSLIGAAREQVALMTARAPWGTSYLPMITIDQVVPKPEIAKSSIGSAGKDTEKKITRTRKKPVQNTSSE